MELAQRGLESDTRLAGKRRAEGLGVLAAICVSWPACWMASR
jgi:hypothetical protein